MFPMAYSTTLFAGPSQAKAHQDWRDAASLVATRWEVFLEAEPRKPRLGIRLLRGGAGCRGGCSSRHGPYCRRGSRP